MNEQSLYQERGPVWASWLGIMAIVFGIFLTAMHGNEVLSHIVYKPGTAAVQDIPINCREDELIEEGLSFAECNLMGTTVKNVIVSSPEWFRNFHITLSAVGVVMAIISIVMGILLLDFRAWIVKPAIFVFGSLLAIDMISFLAIVNTGPLLRAMYLWDTLLWALIHVVLMSATMAGQHLNSD